ncbi:hypothetical protein CL617_04375 [archaeon]|nr:hypothetical protein [archaeon]|tara:strand:+ start:8263 stop:9534 length:1272 start_codon:yes stop_codon:yes gene_type:complete
MKKIGVYIGLLVLFSISVLAQSNSPVAIAGEDLTTTPGRIIILDASQSYDLDNDITESSFKWYENEQQIGQGKILRLTYSETGRHFITLRLTDSKGLSSADIVSIKLKEKEVCTKTKAVYFPQDTICNSKWPSQDGDKMFINSEDFSCNLIEVCSDELDPIVKDSIKCCSSAILDSSSKDSSCSFAQRKSNGNFKKCQALYVTKGLGTDQTYMEGYFEAEMCCSAIEGLCSNQRNFYSLKPIPRTNTNTDFRRFNCGSTPEYNPPGEWVSNLDLSKNNLALSDLPPSVTINTIGTGTCVDFSLSITTLLRKIGYKSDEIYSVSTENHAFNLVKFPLDRKFTIIDTTGTSQDIRLGKKPSSYEYCEELDKCWNDLGQVACPALSNIVGCEGVPEDFFRKTERTKFKITDTSKKIIRAIAKEASF